MASRKEEIRKEIKKKNEKEGLNPEEMCIRDSHMGVGGIGYQYIRKYEGVSWNE